MENLRPITEALASLCRPIQAALSTGHSLKLSYEPQQIRTLLSNAYQIQVALRGFNPTSTAEITDRITAIAAWLASPTRCGLMLYGSLGSGKTTIAKAIREVMRACKGLNVYYWPASKLVELSRGTLTGVDATFNNVKRSAVLIIDDLGTEPLEVKEYGNSSLPIVDLICYRYDNQLPVIITTNLDDNKIAEVYGSRILDRLNEMCSRFAFTSKSFR